MRQYLELTNRVLNEGRLSDNRTGTNTLAIFGHQMTFDLSNGFPLVTTKSVNLRAVINELIWFIHGKTNINDPELGGSKIWDEWAVKAETQIQGLVNIDELLGFYANRMGVTHVEAVNTYRLLCAECSEDDQPGFATAAREKLFAKLGLSEGEVATAINAKQIGSIGPMYGAQWRDFDGVDQLQELIFNLQNNPMSRRHVVSAWNPKYLPNERMTPEHNVQLGKGALAPCHCFFQFDVERLTEREQIVDGHGRQFRLNCQFYMRSSDVGLGLPFNIASYAMLQLAICNELDYAPGKLSYCGGNVHIYENHVEGLREQCTRTPRTLPTMVITRPVGTSIFDLKAEDFVVTGYDPHPAIKLPISK